MTHEKLNLESLLLCFGAVSHTGDSLVISSDDLLPGGFSAGLVINNTVTGHIDAHIGGRVVGTLAEDLLEDGIQNRKDLYVTVIIDSGLSVSLQMEGIDHVYVIQISSGSLVS